MSRLEIFSEEQRELLISLPYRTGFWVSACDSSGGEEADEIEHATLVGVIEGFATDFCKTEVVEDLMRAALERKDRWSEWEANIERVPTECRSAVELLAENFDYKEVNSFKNNLLQIATSVAMSYTEFDEETSMSVKLKMYVRLATSKLLSIIGKSSPVSTDEILSVSHEEQRAINELIKVLKMGENEGMEPKYDFDPTFQDKDIESNKITGDAEGASMDT
jgi:hypothetical protein